MTDEAHKPEHLTIAEFLGLFNLPLPIAHRIMLVRDDDVIVHPWWSACDCGWMSSNRLTSRDAMKAYQTHLEGES